MATEEKIVKIVDKDLHTRGVSVDAIGMKGALLVKTAASAPTDETQLNASYEISNVNGEVSYVRYLTKTIDGTSYRRTLSYNSDGELLGVTEWTAL